VKIYQIDPIKDARWTELVETHSGASIFHTVGWLETLKQTYNYDPIAFTTSPPTGPLTNGIVFCRVKSWLTGSRLVSLPFSDHCAPLCETPDELNFMIRYLQTTLEHENWRYVEIRSSDERLHTGRDSISNPNSPRYLLHVLDLRPEPDEIFRGLAKDSVQRRVHHARKSGLTEQVGTSDDLLKQFYDLFIVTRSRHRMPPTPIGWFRNLIRFHRKSCEIRIANYGGIPVAAILTLRFRETLYYKYGCSDLRFKNLGATPWLLWNSIVAAKKSGATAFDMGRTEEENSGLIAFKNHWVANPQQLVYWSYPNAVAAGSNNGWLLRTAKRVFGHMPDKLLSLTGKLFYRHIG
jgi:hypothetical protein